MLNSVLTSTCTYNYIDHTLTEEILVTKLASGLTGPFMWLVAVQVLINVTTE